MTTTMNDDGQRMALIAFLAHHLERHFIIRHGFSPIFPTNNIDNDEATLADLNREMSSAGDAAAAADDEHIQGDRRTGQAVTSLLLSLLFLSHPALGLWYVQ